MENGTLAPQAAKCMKTILESLKNIEFIDPVVTVKSTLDETATAALYELADALK